MKSVVLLLCGLPASAISFFVQWREQWLPKPPPPEKIKWEHDRSTFHNLKNQTTEWVRSDSEWWSKFLLWIILLEEVRFWVW